MAGVSFFGEVVQQSSRAFWNDEDSDDEVDAATTNDADVCRLLQVSCPEENPNHHTLIIADGKVASEFATNFLVNSEQCKSAKTHQVDERINIGNATSTLIKLKDSIFVCVCRNVPTELANQFTKLLSPWMKGASRIIILGSAVSVDYKCYDSDLLAPSFLRCLATDRWKESVKAPLMETPNILSGVPASVLSYCEVQNFPAVLYVCYAESLRIDSRSMQPLINLFQTSGELSSLLKPSKDLKNYNYSSTITHSNMYL